MVSREVQCACGTNTGPHDKMPPGHSSTACSTLLSSQAERLIERFWCDSSLSVDGDYTFFAGPGEDWEWMMAHRMVIKMQIRGGIKVSVEAVPECGR